MKCRKCKAIKPKEDMKMKSDWDDSGRRQTYWECKDCNETPKERP